MYFLILPDSSIGVERQRRGAGRQPGSSGVQPPQPAPAPAPSAGAQLPRPGSPQKNTGVSFPPGQDMRKHVIMTLLDTEQSYVESLRTLMQVRWHGTGCDAPNRGTGAPWSPQVCTRGCTRSCVAPGWIGVTRGILGTAGAEVGAL